MEVQVDRHVLPGVEAIPAVSHMRFVFNGVLPIRGVVRTGARAGTEVAKSHRHTRNRHELHKHVRQADHGLSMVCIQWWSRQHIGVVC